MCSYVTLWQCPIVLVGHSFGSIVIKKFGGGNQQMCEYKKTTNEMETTTHRNCKRIFENLKGMLFYIGVPYSSSTTKLPLYFAWQY